MNQDLKKFGVIHRVVQGCKCSKSFLTYIYTIPIQLDENIVNFMSKFGNLAVDFNKTALLKIENQNLSIVGVKRLKEVKLILKNNKDIGIIDSFEKSLAEYVKLKKEIKE